MSTSRIPHDDYSMEYDPATGYVTFDLEDEELAKEAVQEYNTETSLYSILFDSILFTRPTPVINQENPTEVLVSDTQTEDFKEIADEVLEA